MGDVYRARDTRLDRRVALTFGSQTLGGFNFQLTGIGIYQDHPACKTRYCCARISRAR